MKKKKVLNKILILVFIVTLIILVNINKNEIKGFVSNVFNIQRKASTNLKNATRLYFNAEVTKTYGNGDLILLENYDSSGNTKYALVDAGRAVNKQDKDGKPSTVIVEFLKDHNVNELEFVFITHSHGDHNGGLLDTSTGKGLIQYAIDNPSFKIKKIIMKEFDSEYSLGGSQGTYEKFIEFAIDKNIPVLGVSYASLKSDKISPNRSDEFKEKVTSAKEANFSSFNSTNTKFKFGSSDLTIINWELFNDEGKQIYTDSNGFKTVDGKATTRESVSNENNNTIGLLIKQGNKKAFLSGDINNLDANASTGRIGDEDRIKDEIGKVDFLKLGHHGYNQSNTDNYINVLKPDYVSITNDIGGAYKDIVKWLEKNSTNYLYTTSDQYGISVTITNNDVYLGFETDDSFKEVGDTTYYIPKGEQNKYADYLEVAYKVDYQEENISVSNWSELKNAIENTNDNCSTLDTSKKICYLKKQVITLNPGTWTADSMITIKSNQKVVLKSTQAITITRATTNTANPFFNILGSLDLGINNMSGTITLDGNKANVAATSSLIKIDSGTLNFYNNITLTNNMNKTTKVTNSSTTVDYSSFGSAIYGKNSIINMYGGTISNNEEEVAYTLTLSGKKSNAYRLATMGVGIYLTSSSKFNMTGGTIKGNKGINNSVVQTKENAYTYNYMNRGITQMCYGIGVYAVSNSVVNINGGSITDNTAINNSKLIMNPSGDSENISSIQSDNMSIYGVGLYVTDSHLTIGDGANISNNKATLKATAEIKNNTIIKGSLTSSVRGVNLYSSSNVLTINNATMNNASYTNIPNITNNNTSSSIENYTGIGTNGTSNPALINYGGSAYITNNIDYNINKLTMANSTSDYGGATYITGSGGTISNSTFNKNTANNFGGALYLSSTNQTINLNNTTVTENKTLTGSGGGIYTYNSLNINGSSTTIKSNIAHTYGGGIMCKTNCIMYDGQILNNEATLNAGGGIRVDGKFLLVNGEIKNNKANLTGGGIDYTTGTYTKTGGTVSGNTAPTGNEIYPTSKDTTDTNPPVIKISTINDDYTKNDVTVTFTANDYEKGIKKVSVGSTTLSGTNGKYTYKVTSNGTYTITAEDNAGNKSIGDGYLTASNPCESSVFVENSCRVRVNVDTTYPSVDVDSVGAYERTSGNERASGAVNLLSSTSVKKDSANEYTIAANSYTNSDLQSKSYWFNESFNEGVLYEITLKDNIHLDSWKWETNAPYYAENKSNGYQAFRSGSVGENSSGTIPSDMTHSNCGTLSYTISVYLKDEGYRRGRLTISDKAGNKTTLIIEAKIDRTPPSVPTVSFHTFNKAGTSVTTTAYTPKTWSQYSIEAKGTKPSDNKALNGNKTLNPSNGNLSGFKEFKYQGKNAKGSDISGTTTEKFNLKGDDFEGENKIQFSSCDTAGNCSDFTTLYDVWLDTKAPTVRILAQKKNSDDKVTTAKDVTVDNSTKNWKYTIDYKDYEGLVSNWMNASNYKGGVTYQVTISDNVSKASYEWASGHNDDKVAKTTISGKKAETYTMKFTKEGQRSGKLTVKDIAGNTIEVTIKAYLDRTKPTTPTITNPSNENWTNQNIYLTLASSDPTGNAIDGKVSGIGKYQWHYAGKSWSDYASSAKTSYQTTAYSAERNEAAYQRACDKAGNCSSASSTMIRIDKTAPKLTLGHTRSCTSGVGNKVTSSCSDQGTVKSGIQSAPGDKTIRWGKSDTLSFTCTDNAGNSTKKSYTLTYNSCACGENTCKYGCDTCGGGAYTSVYTVSKTCSKEVCEGGHITSDSCLDFEYWNDGECCSILEKDCSYTKSKTCYYPTYSCNCSNCYYGHNTCQYGYK